MTAINTVARPATAMKLISKNLSSSADIPRSHKVTLGDSGGKPFHYKSVSLISAKSKIISFNV